jgi:hypothetical protein
MLARGCATALLDAPAAAGDEVANFLRPHRHRHAAGLLMLSGAICASANLVPETVVAAYEAFLAGELDDALHHEARLRPTQAALTPGTHPPRSSPRWPHFASSPTAPWSRPVIPVRPGSRLRRGPPDGPGHRLISAGRIGMKTKPHAYRSCQDLSWNALSINPNV